MQSYQGYIVKPINKADLIQNLRDFASHRHSSPVIRMSHGQATLTSPTPGIPQGLSSSNRMSPELSAVGHGFVEPAIVFPNTSRQALTMHPLGTRHVRSTLRHPIPLPQYQSATMLKNDSSGKNSAIVSHLSARMIPSIASTPENTSTSGILLESKLISDTQTRVAGAEQEMSPVMDNAKTTI